MIEDRRHEGGSLLSVIYRHVTEQRDGTLAIVPDAAELAVVKFTSAVPGVIDEIWVALDMSPIGYLTPRHHPRHPPQSQLTGSELGPSFAGIPI